ncbi:PP0621 family protein [Cupriavidus basilensis]
MSAAALSSKSSRTDSEAGHGARIFLVLAVVLGFFWWLSPARRGAPAGRSQPPGMVPRKAVRDGRTQPAQEPMVQCAQCGVHLPLGEAIAYRGLHATAGAPTCPPTAILTARPHER